MLSYQTNAQSQIVNHGLQITASDPIIVCVHEIFRLAGGSADPPILADQENAGDGAWIPSAGWWIECVMCNISRSPGIRPNPPLAKLSLGHT